jgi:FkbM family methyltransferase
MKLVKLLVKKIFDAAGYLVVNKLDIGHDHLVDIQTIAKTHNIDMSLILDVGAHQGGSAKAFKRAFPDAKIHCFEPDPRSFEALERNLADKDRVYAHQLAVSDVAGNLPFFIYENTCINSLEPNAPFAETYGEVAKQITVQVLTIDEFLASNSLHHVSLLKIDTEGREPEVLNGALQALKKHQIDFLFLEFNSVVTSEKSSPLVDIAEILEPLGYRFIATYNDYCNFGEQGFNVSNVLFSRNFTKSKEC